MKRNCIISISFVILYSIVNLNVVPVRETMTIEPEKRPAEPIPAIALPTMKATDVGATAVTRLPSSKTNIAPK